MSEVGEDQKIAQECAEALFNAIPKSKRLELIGELNELLVYIGKHPHTEKGDKASK